MSEKIKKNPPIKMTSGAINRLLFNSGEQLKDHGFSFVFSSNIDDWTSSKFRKKRERSRKTYKELYVDTILDEEVSNA